MFERLNYESYPRVKRETKATLKRNLEHRGELEAYFIFLLKFTFHVCFFLFEFSEMLRKKIFKLLKVNIFERKYLPPLRKLKGSVPVDSKIPPGGFFSLSSFIIKSNVCPLDISYLFIARGWLNRLHG